MRTQKPRQWDVMSRGRREEEKWVREGRKKAFSLWSCINTKIIPGPTESRVIWAPPHFNHMVPAAPLTFCAPDRVDFLQSHHRDFVHAVSSVWNDLPSPSLSLLSLLFSFILQHCFLKEVFIDLGHVKIPYRTLS